MPYKSSDYGRRKAPAKKAGGRKMGKKAVKKTAKKTAKKR
tara:strand:- start:695 stop:814 length:120 start_codon:yes stop_codon:yes gene_type:complete